MDIVEENSAASFRDSITTIGADGKRSWIYAQKPKGSLYTKRTIVSLVYLCLFFAIPFVKIAGEPLFLINIPERKFILFSAVFWPQDTFLFVIGMLIFIVFIIIFTVVFGRIFCGWACPQTIFMEMVFRKIEYWIEGDASYQKLLNKGPWTNEKVVKKTSKIFLFFVVSYLIANTFLAYIVGIDKVFALYNSGPSNPEHLFHCWCSHLYFSWSTYGSGNKYASSFVLMAACKVYCWTKTRLL
jgi:hypothetical protein